MVEEKSADYQFFVKENQATLYDAIATLDDDRWSEPCAESYMGYVRSETCTIWTSSEVPCGATFPHVAQVVGIMREVDDAKTTSHTTPRPSTR